MTTQDDTRKFLLKRSIVEAALTLLAHNPIDKHVIKKESDALAMLSQVDDERVLCMTKDLVATEHQVLSQALYSAIDIIESLDEIMGLIRKDRRWP